MTKHYLCTLIYQHYQHYKAVYLSKKWRIYKLGQMSHVILGARHVIFY